MQQTITWTNVDYVLYHWVTMSQLICLNKKKRKHFSRNFSVYARGIKIGRFRVFSSNIQETLNL